MRLPKSIGVDIGDRPARGVSIWIVTIVALAAAVTGGRTLRAADAPASPRAVAAGETQRGAATIDVRDAEARRTGARS